MWNARHGETTCRSSWTRYHHQCECSILFFWNAPSHLKHRLELSMMSTFGHCLSGRMLPNSLSYLQVLTTDHRFDGKALEPSYNPAPFTGTEPTADFPNGKTYTGGCHCGNITMAFKTEEPLPKGHEYIQECNCSICMRVGILLQLLLPR